MPRAVRARTSGTATSSARASRCLPTGTLPWWAALLTTVTTGQLGGQATSARASLCQATGAPASLEGLTTPARPERPGRSFDLRLAPALPGEGDSTRQLVSGLAVPARAVGGREPGERRALGLLRRAAAKGYLPSVKALAWALERTDHDEAMRWLERAASLGDDESQRVLAIWRRRTED